MPKAGSSKTGSRLLEHFLGDEIIVYIKGVDTEISNEDQTAVVPLTLQALLIDYDDCYLLLSNDDKTAYSLINQNMVAKIDTVDDSMQSLLDPNRPAKKAMN